ncbi:MAG: GspE/PulE family protein [Candidatus Nealsonbacteria bacterium]|nr:GspE/PulE family protein [Candidatus Nealsonbacteria bacterium]
MEQSLKKITGEIELSPSLLNIAQNIKNVSDFAKEANNFLGKSITEFLEIILGAGIFLKTSDIHIEPQEEKANIRLRLDGILQEVMSFDLKILQALTSRIKLLSGVKLNITDRPQDGRFSVLITAANEQTMAIEIRASFLPSEHGESIVFRILNPQSLISLEALGLRKDLLALFEKEIKKPNGMIIVTGPTGSGKTTTLYAFLKNIQRPEIKVITIEDPIEYHLKGISQTQTVPEKGYDFASGLKSIMRQDPDVILVGEIRDLETAEIGLQAALTGHLVLTTLHTNDAAGTIARLISLGSSASNIGPAINIAIAQRLVRRVCKKCSTLQTIPVSALEKIKKELQNLPKKIEIPKLSQELKIAKIKGCPDCNFTGYRGRIGILEVLIVDGEMEKFILTLPSITGLKEKAIEKGMVPMLQDGLIKVLEKITTLEEIERVIGISSKEP